MEIKCKICGNKNNIIILKNDDVCFAICNNCLNSIKKYEVATIDEYNTYLKNKIKIYNKKYKASHKDKQKEYKKKYKEKHNLKSMNDKEYMKKYREEHKEYYKEYSKKYAQKKKEERKQLKIKKQIEEDEIKKLKKQNKEKLNKIKKRTRCLINKSFVRKGYRKDTKTEQILNCDFDIFYNHLLHTFKENYGYDWDGIEAVDIDHIIPLATAKSEEDVIKLCHYTNLQLLKRLDNRKKSAKL